MQHCDKIKQTGSKNCAAPQLASFLHVSLACPVFESVTSLFWPFFADESFKDAAALLRLVQVFVCLYFASLSIRLIKFRVSSASRNKRVGSMQFLIFLESINAHTHTERFRSVEGVLGQATRNW